MNTWNNKSHLHLCILDPQTAARSKEKKNGNEENIPPITDIAVNVLTKPLREVQLSKPLTEKKLCPNRPAPPRPDKVVTNQVQMRIPLPTRKPPAKPTASQELTLPAEPVVKKEKRVRFNTGLNQVLVYHVKENPESEERLEVVRTAIPLPQVPPLPPSFVPRYLANQSPVILHKDRGELEFHWAKKS